MTVRNVMHAIVAVCGCLALPAGALAQDDKLLSIELNDAADVNEGCRLSYIALNGTGMLLDKASFEVFTFDAQGKVAQSLVFEFGRLPVGKTKVVQFDMAGQKCSAISRLLINDIVECTADGANSTICIDALKTTTRASIAFGL